MVGVCDLKSGRKIARGIAYQRVHQSRGVRIVTISGGYGKRADEQFAASITRLNECPDVFVYPSVEHSGKHVVEVFRRNSLDHSTRCDGLGLKAGKGDRKSVV